MTGKNTPAPDASTSNDGHSPTEGAAGATARRIETLYAANEALRARVAALEAAASDSPEAGDATATQSKDDASVQTEFASGRGGLGLSWRGPLATLASLGLLGAATGSASAHHSGHDHLGETWSGDPGDPGLKLDLGSGTDVALFGASASPSARVLKGHATASSGQTIGIEGKAESPDSIALLGNATATAGGAKGLEGRSAAKFGTGVIGFAKHATGTTKGVRGLAQSPNGRGIEATNTASSGAAFGLTAETQSPSGVAIRGDATSSSGTTYGIRGMAASPNGYGLHTPNDAKIEGTTELTTIDTTGNDFTVEAGTTDTDKAQNVVHGHASNEVTDDAVGATIGGGGQDDGSTVLPNRVHDDWGTVGGGAGNEAGDGDGDPISASWATVGGGLKNTAAGSSTVGGGIENTASATGTIGGGRDNEASGGLATVGGGNLNVASTDEATVGGGHDNLASGENSIVGGGEVNDATAQYATVMGGHANTASATYATVPGGASNTADGLASFAAGRLADTNGHDGAFVFGDSSTTAITAQNPDEVRSQMPIYAPSFNTTSARAAKTAVDLVDPGRVLDGVESLDIHTWTLEHDHADAGRHMGPMAEEFHDTFELDGDAETIATVDADGVAFAAIQGLAARLEEEYAELVRENIHLREEHAEKDEQIIALQTETEAKAEILTDLEGRLADLEAAVGTAQEVPADD